MLAPSFIQIPSRAVVCLSCGKEQAGNTGSRVNKRVKETSGLLVLLGERKNSNMT